MSDWDGRNTLCKCANRNECDECDGLGWVKSTPAPDHAQARDVVPILVRMYEDGRNDLPSCDFIYRVVRQALAASPQEGREAVDTQAYRGAVGGCSPDSPLAHEWRDKPHRLVYDLCREIERLRATPPVAPLPPVVTPPTDDEALDLWRAVKRNQVDEADAVVMFTRLLTAALGAPQAAPVVTEASIGLHARVEIVYEVDQYRARLIHENEAVLAEAVGATPSLALAALAERPRD